MSTYQYEEADRGAGWLLFAGMMLMIAAIMNTIGGIAAIDDANFYTSSAHYQFGSLHTWGWIILLIGMLQFFAAFSIWRGGEYGRWVGVLSAAANAVAQLFFIPAAPLWSLAIFALDVMVMYGLLVYGGRNAPGRAAPRTTTEVPR